MSGIMPALRSTVHEICGPEHVAQGMTYADSEKKIILIGRAGGKKESPPDICAFQLSLSDVDLNSYGTVGLQRS